MTGSEDEDTSPPEIQRLRKQYIADFMDTGNFSGPLHQQLLAYALTQRKPEDVAVTQRGTAHNSAKITDADVIAIRAAMGVTHLSLAERYGVNKSQISRIRAGKLWSHVTGGEE